MSKDYTHIAVILDRTGSMYDIRDDIIGGFNSFVEEQKKVEGKATLTLVQFDSKDPYEVIHSFKSIGEIPPLTERTYIPRARTPLLDAIGKGIGDLESQLGGLKKHRTPSKIVFVIITDGRENDSKEYNKGQIKKMIAEKEKEDWQIVFLSSDLEAVRDAQVDYGTRYDITAPFRKSSDGVAAMYTQMSHSISAYREGLTAEIEIDKDGMMTGKKKDARK